MKIDIPKFFNMKHVDDFLRLASFIFYQKDKPKSDFVLDISKVKEICLLGQLLLYKFVSYTVEKQCFIYPKIKVRDDSFLKELLGRSGFWELIYTYIQKPNDKKAIEKSYNNLKIVNCENLLIAPLRLLRKESADRERIENGYLNKIMDFYKNTPISRTISFCITELFSNFWSHATKDTGTVMVACGNSDTIEICFADSGEGIINSFIDSNAEYRSMEKHLVMKKALQKGVTSKPNSNHLGLGLYMINCIVSHSKGSSFRIYSDTEEYIYDGSNQGKYNTKSYWGGTITYLRLNTKTLVTLDRINVLKTPSFNKIQWG